MGVSSFSGSRSTDGGTEEHESSSSAAPTHPDLEIRGGAASDRKRSHKQKGKTRPTSRQLTIPARIDSLIETLRRTSEGEGVAEALDLIIDNAPEFRLFRAPADEWEYLQDLLAVFWRKPKLAVAYS
jgi:hypothetical protein